MKHIFSPQHFLLAKFIMLYFGPNNKHVSRGFQQITRKRIVSNAIYNFTNKEYDGKLLNDVKQKTLGYYRGVLKNDKLKLSPPSLKKIISKLESTCSVGTQKRSYHNFTKP